MRAVEVDKNEEKSKNKKDRLTPSEIFFSLNISFFGKTLLVKLLSHTSQQHKSANRNKNADLIYLHDLT